MGLSLSLSPRQTLLQSQVICLKQSIGETVGDIPLYSLHRIKGLLQRESPALSPELRRELERAIIRGNRRYQEESGNRRWSCLTSNNLVEAIGEFDAHIGVSIAQVETSVPDDQTATKQAILDCLRTKRAQTVETVKVWFDARSDRLLYDMSGKIPWAIVLRLRRSLSAWIAGAADVFKSDIEDTILEVAHEQGVHSDDPEDAWERMGGTVFTNERKH